MRDVRAVDAPVPVRVVGRPPGSSTSRRRLRTLPIALSILATTTLVILFLMTGSVILPVKALVMNLLTLSAAFGLLVLIFQDGHGEGLLGLHEPGRSGVPAQPVLLLFAVSSAVDAAPACLLLTRIKEAHDAGATNEEAVALGLERTGRGA